MVSEGISRQRSRKSRHAMPPLAPLPSMYTGMWLLIAIRSSRDPFVEGVDESIDVVRIEVGHVVVRQKRILETVAILLLQVSYPRENCRSRVRSRRRSRRR